jgi:hypothetical protein
MHLKNDPNQGTFVMMFHVILFKEKTQDVSREERKMAYRKKIEIQNWGPLL